MKLLADMLVWVLGLQIIIIIGLIIIYVKP